VKKNPLYPSRLRNRVEFLRRVVTVEHGISKERWETAFICWCGAEPLSGREFWEAAAINRENEVRFTIRYRKDVSAEMRIRLDSTVYDITSILDKNNRHEALEILARTVTPDGKCQN
jgi:SPP1 family predicted phage head-tail adaptor